MLHLLDRSFASCDVPVAQHISFFSWSKWMGHLQFGAPLAFPRQLKSREKLFVRQSPISNTRNWNDHCACRARLRDTKVAGTCAQAKMQMLFVGGLTNLPWRHLKLLRLRMGVPRWFLRAVQAYVLKCEGDVGNASNDTPTTGSFWWSDCVWRSTVLICGFYVCGRTQGYGYKLQ